MQPIEFIMEFSGIAKVLGPDEAPTPAQWKRIHEMLGETVGPLMARKLFELGEEAEKQQQQKQELMEEIMKQAYTPGKLSPLYPSPAQVQWGTAGVMSTLGGYNPNIITK